MPRSQGQTRKRQKNFHSLLPARKSVFPADLRAIGRVLSDAGKLKNKKKFLTVDWRYALWAVFSIKEGVENESVRVRKKVEKNLKKLLTLKKCSALMGGSFTRERGFSYEAC